MNYANPKYLHIALSAALLLGLFYILVMRRRKVLMERFADKSLLSEIASSVSMRKKILKIAMISLAAVMMLIAMARPQWNFEWEEVKRSGLDILVAMDVSKSMLARDVKPNRLERSKFAVKDMIKKLNGDRIGLIAFSGTAFLQCPLTIDYDGFLLSLDDLSTETIPRPGTSISAAIREAMDVFRGPEAQYKVLIIITDGEDLEGDALKMALEASKFGTKVYCVGVGTRDGDIIPVSNERGERSYLADRSGNVVKTRLDEELLKKLAISTGGSYVHATQSEFGLSLLYDTSISKLEKRDIETKMKKHYEEHFQLFLAIALALLFIEPFISEKKRPA